LRTGVALLAEVLDDLCEIKRKADFVIIGSDVLGHVIKDRLNPRSEITY
jgi:hypothetical protein